MLEEDLVEELPRRGPGRHLDHDLESPRKRTPHFLGQQGLRPWANFSGPMPVAKPSTACSPSRRTPKMPGFSSSGVARQPRGRLPVEAASSGTGGLKSGATRNSSSLKGGTRATSPVGFSRRFTAGSVPSSLYNGARLGQLVFLAVAVGECGLPVDAQEMEQCRGQVAGRESVGGRMAARFVAGTVDLAAADPGTGHGKAPDRAPVVPAAVAVDLRRPAELADGHHQRLLQQAALLEVAQQGREADVECRASTSSMRSAFWACVSHRGLSTALSPGSRGH